MNRSRVTTLISLIIISGTSSLLLMTIFSSPMETSSNQFSQRHIQNITRKRNNYIHLFPFKRTITNRTINILLWTTFFGDKNWLEGDLSGIFSNCPYSNCVITKNIVLADVVAFHALDLWTWFWEHELPEYRRQNQVYVLTNFEPPGNVPTSLKKYNWFFNWTMSYRTDSDVHCPYGTFKEVPTANSFRNIASTKTKGIAWVASNCGDDARRQLLVREIQKYVQVDTYGFCGNITLPSETTDEILKKYKFYLAFENSHCRDYITEKFFRSYELKSVPVVSGGGDYKTVAPLNSFIDVRDFTNVSQLAAYLKYLDSNDTAYNTYFEWTKKYTVTGNRNWCNLCKAARDPTRWHQVYKDIEGYVNDDSCQRWTITRWIYRMGYGYATWLGIL